MNTFDFLREPTRFGQAWRSDGAASRNIRFAGFDSPTTPSFTFGMWCSLNGNASLTTSGSTVCSFGDSISNWFDFRLQKHATNATFGLAVFGRRSGGGTTSLSDSVQHPISNGTRMFLAVSYNGAAGSITLMRDRYINSGTLSTAAMPSAGSYPFLIGNRVGAAQVLAVDVGEAFLLQYAMTRNELMRVYYGGAGSDYVAAANRFTSETGLWRFDGDLSDSSGSGNALLQYNSVSAGSPGSSSTPTFVSF